MSNIYNNLLSYSKENYYPFHMPGHKRNTSWLKMGNPYSIDITEIYDFDDLHSPEGMIKEAMNEAANLYGAKASFFSVNGSTGGLLGSIAACTRKRKKIIMARNCHKSVYNAVLLNELTPIYVYPQLNKEWHVNSQISPQDVENLLITNREVGIVVITSPTYEGIVSDIKKISDVVHRFGIPLLVDEAHGAHFGFHPSFPKSSIQLGADIVVQSLHKTLPSFTQTAVVHVKSKIISSEYLRQYINMYQTTSPSYLFLSGMEKCIHILKEQKTSLFNNYADKLNEFYLHCGKLKYIELLRGETEKKDLGKLVISVKNSTMTGKELYDILRNKYHLQMEMAADHYVIAMTSIADTKEGFERLWNALAEIDSLLVKKVSNNKSVEYEHLPMLLIPSEAHLKESETILLYNAKGRISKEYIYLYPPGIPILVPGEQITDWIIRQIQYYKRRGLQIKGLKDISANQIEVVKEE